MATCIILPIYFFMILFGVIQIEAASSPLGMENGNITASQISVTSTTKTITDPNVLNRLRYNCCKQEKGTLSGLCLDANSTQTIQIQLGKPVQVRGITIQAPADTRVGYVMYYKIFYKEKETDSNLTELGSGRFGAITKGLNWSTENKVSLKNPITEKYPPLMETIAIVIDDPSQFHNLPCLRMELFGCPEEECRVMWKNPTVDAIDDGTGKNQVVFRCNISESDHRPNVTHTAIWIYNETSISRRTPDTSDDQIVSLLKQKDLYPYLPDSNNRMDLKRGLKCSVTACNIGECALWRSQPSESNELTPTVKVDLGITTDKLVLEEGEGAHDIKIRLNGPPVMFLHKDIIQMTKGTSVLVQALFNLETRNYKCSTTPSEQRNDVMIEDKCGFEVTSSNWENEHTVKLKAVTDGLYIATKIKRKFDVIAYHLDEDNKEDHRYTIKFTKQPLTIRCEMGGG